MTNVEQVWDEECGMATNRSFVLLPCSTQLLRMKFFGYIIWNCLSFRILPTSTHIVTIFPFRLHYFNYRVEQAAEGKFKQGARKKVHINYISITKLSQIQATFLKKLLSHFDHKIMTLSYHTIESG